MLDTYIKNRGITKTIIHDGKYNGVNQINWDADYDGNVANISLDLKDNHLKKHYDIKLTNDDLENLLNVPTINEPLEKRLRKDFYKKKTNYQPLIIEFERPKTHISSPLIGEELIVPLAIDNKKYTISPRRHYHRKHRLTYKLHKHPKRKYTRHSRRTRRNKTSKHSTRRIHRTTI